MFALLERLERMGRKGAAPALVVAVLLVGGAVALIAVSFQIEDPSRWTVGGLRGAGFFAGCLGAVFAMLGIRLATARVYPPASEVFPSMSREAFVAGLEERTGVVCACSACRIQLPAEFSTGACPRCASTVNYYEVITDEDARMVILGMST